MPASITRRRASASARRVGYRMAVWYSPVAPGGGGDPPRPPLGFEPVGGGAPPRRHERRLRAVPLRQPEAEDAAVELQRPPQVGDLQVDVADADARINRAG